ncbi:hypothetical protein IJH02_03295 [Candidatus Saccharibacteria bacterium]|nr:hypothetical protein [Candidatus Saccharibacteria bacterium]
MSDAVIVGIISVVGSIVVQLIVSASKTRETNATLATHEQKQQDAIEDVKKEMVEVKKRLDSHNGYAEKFADAKKDIALTQRDVEFIKEQLKNMQMCKTK